MKMEYSAVYTKLVSKTQIFDIITASYRDDSISVVTMSASHYLAALFQLLLHLLSWQVYIDDQVWGQELTDANALYFFVVLHTCKPHNIFFLELCNVWTVCNTSNGCA